MFDLHLPCNFYNSYAMRILLSLIILFACRPEAQKKETYVVDDGRIIVGAERVEDYIEEIAFKNVAVVVNQSSLVSKKHLVDVMLAMGIEISKIFAPEHGFRGIADAGEKIEDGKDSKTGLPIISLYGKKKKPSTEDLKGIDVILFDIQDVGVRFYTYLSTLHYVLEAAAENNIKVIVLDRPNPNAQYIDGPIMEEAFKSYVGMHPVPVVYGMTIGEYAHMINGEKWLNDSIQCDLTVMKCKNYNHSLQYVLPVKPSPNLPNAMAVANYPSLCFFEGTTVSIGRGTDTPFQIVGHPDAMDMTYTFTPESKPGAKYPKHQFKTCYGIDLTQKKPKAGGLDLSYLLYFYDMSKEFKFQFFNNDVFFDLLAGTDQLKAMIEAGKSESEIKQSWEAGLVKFKLTREKYLIYD